MSASSQQLLEDLTRLVGDIDELVKSAAQAMTDGADEHVAGREDSLLRVRGKLDSMKRALTAEAHRRVAAVDGYFRDNTWKTVATAAGLAFIAGFLVGRPSRD